MRLKIEHCRTEKDSGSCRLYTVKARVTAFHQTPVINMTLPFYRCRNVRYFLVAIDVTVRSPDDELSRDRKSLLFLVRRELRFLSKSRIITSNLLLRRSRFALKHCRDRS